MYVFSKGVRALICICIALVAIAFIAVTTPFLVNQAGTIGMVLLPLLAFGLGYGALYVLRIAFTKKSTTQTESKEDSKNV